VGAGGIENSFSFGRNLYMIARPGQHIGVQIGGWRVLVKTRHEGASGEVSLRSRNLTKEPTATS